MSLLFSRILYVRRKERKSLIILLSLILIAGFLDNIFFAFQRFLSNANSVNNSKMILVLQDSVSEESFTGLMDTLVPVLDKTLESNNSFKSEKQYEILGNDTSEFILEIEQETENMEVVFEKNSINPNTVSKDSLMLLGVSAYAAKNWVKYTAAGAQLLNKQDLLRIYGLDSLMVQKILPYLKFPHHPKKNNSFIKKMDINKATVEDFRQIKGIGVKLSERIIKFRNKLGGFYHPDQLKEVYGLTDSLVDANLKYLYLEETIQKININTATVQELASHPYCSYSIANSIVKYKNQHGAFSNIHELLKIHLIDENWLNQIEAYLSVL